MPGMAADSSSGSRPFGHRVARMVDHPPPTVVQYTVSEAEVKLPQLVAFLKV